MTSADSDSVDGDAPIRFRIVGAESGLPLRQVLSRRLVDTSPSRAAAIIKAGGVYLGNVRIRIPSVRVAEGERLTVYAGAADVEPVDVDALRVVARGADYVIVDKARGVPTTATRARARGTLSAALVRRLAREGLQRPYVGLVCGLERGASGLVLFTIRGQDRRSVHAQFCAAPCRRTFRARVRVPPRDRTQTTWTCEQPVVVTRAGVVRLAAEGERGVAARTEFRRLSAPLDRARVPVDPGDPVDPVDLVEVVLDGHAPSGQIVAHARALGLHLLADEELQALESATPGVGARARRGLSLHAASLEFRHPVTGETVRAESAGPSWARVDVDA